MIIGQVIQLSVYRLLSEEELLSINLYIFRNTRRHMSFEPHKELSIHFSKISKFWLCSYPVRRRSIWLLRK